MIKRRIGKGSGTAPEEQAPHQSWTNSKEKEEKEEGKQKENGKNLTTNLNCCF